MSTPDNILLIDKPVGITSFDVIRRLRRELGIRKMGHAGTLDPLASGLMLIGVGEGTKRLAQYVKTDKEYVAEIRIGERRTTGDLAGEVVEAKEVVGLEHEAVEAALASLIGTLTLPVSAFSAIKKDGVPMYKRAHAAARVGETVPDIPKREMKVYEAELLRTESTTIEGMSMVVVTVRFFVGSGTYVRSLAEELGRRLGFPATLQALRRTKVGEFRVEDARTL